METCDVIIVGGGPAGSSCAGALRRAGLDVVLLDRRTFPRDKVCGGWITPPVVAALQLDLEDYASRRVLQPITGFRTGVIDAAREVATDFHRPVSYGIRRCEFDHFLLGRSAVRCLLGQAIDSLERHNDTWTVNDAIRAPLIVGAGGHFCPVARRLRLSEPDTFSLVTAQEAEFPLTESDRRRTSVQPEIPELFFCSDLAGYGWCFRKGDYLNIGLGRTDANRLSEHVAEFRRFLHERGKVDESIPARFHGHAYRLYDAVEPRLLDDGVLLVGDAAGLAHPQSGEGIRPAVESGLLAADAIVAAAGDYRREKLESYRRHILERFGNPRRRDFTHFLPAACVRSLSRILLGSETFVRQIVLQRWFLGMNRPALVDPSLSTPGK